MKWYIRYLIAVSSVRAVFWVGGFDIFNRGSEAGFALMMSLLGGLVIFGISEIVRMDKV